MGAVVIAAVALLASPYLARLTLTAPADEDKAWWRGRAGPTRTRLVATAAVGVTLGALAGLAAGVSLLLVPFALLALVATPLVVIDVECHRLPNRLVFTLAVAAPLSGLGVAALRHDWHPLLRAVEGAAAVLVALFALAFAAPKAFGYGDVKLGGVLGGYLGWFGWGQVYYGIFAGFVLGAVVAVGLLATRRASLKSAVAFGPMLVAGALVVLALDLVPELS